MKVKIKNKSTHALPEYHSKEAAGMDIRAFLNENIELKPLQRALIPTGIYIELSKGFEAQIRPRSGLAIKHGITLLNTPGTIDADYRGEIKIIVINLSDIPFVIKDGDRIAQMVIGRHERIEWEKVEVLNDSDREAGGFGSTGN